MKANTTQVKAFCRVLCNRYNKMLNDGVIHPDIYRRIKERTARFTDQYSLSSDQLQLIINTYEILDIEIKELGDLWK